MVHDFAVTQILYGNLCHLLISEGEIPDVAILLHTLHMDGLRYDGHTAPDIPAENHLLCALAVLLSNLSQLRIGKNSYSARPSLSTQSCTSDSETLERNRSPSSHSPVPAISSRSLPLSPIPKEDDVANGITVLPVSSRIINNHRQIRSSSASDIRHGRSPHQLAPCIIAFMVGKQ